MKRRTRLGLGLTVAVPMLLGEAPWASAKFPFHTAPPTTAPSGAGATSGATTRPSAASAERPRTPVIMEPPGPPPEDLKPLGFAGFDVSHPAAAGGAAAVGLPRANPLETGYVPIPDRWRIGFPSGYQQNETSATLLDPYHQNELKGDYPVFGTQDVFLMLTLTSDTLAEQRRIPTPSAVSTDFPGKFGFFGQSRQSFVEQQFILSAEVFKGDAGYRPKDWAFKATVVTDVNFLQAGELGVINPDFREGHNRTDAHVAFQELFAEYKLADLSTNFDFISVRAGIQEFTSDFRGFLFSDEEPGVRLFGNLNNNRIQYNLAWFYQLEKDTNSGLNTFNGRDQNVFIGNVFLQDFLTPGYTATFSVHYNMDNGDKFAYDRNGILARPEPVGVIGTKDVHVVYLGWGGDGHIGRLNITNQVYEALGYETFNALAGHGVSINAQLAAIELSYDFDYTRLRGSFMYLSGDHNPKNGEATGFDTIFDNANFAGSNFDYFSREAIPLLGTGVNLVGDHSFVPDLRTSKEEGQANFVNPGLLLYNLGYDIDLTQKVTLFTNATYLQFVNTSTLQQVLQVSKINNDIGLDLSIGIQYRPFLNNNAIFTFGEAALIPAAGFKDIYTSETLYSTFVALTLTY